MKKTKFLLALLLIAVMVPMCTSCIFMDSIDWAYSEFQREETTEDLLYAMGIPVSRAVYAPYVYSCTVQRTDLMGEPDKNSASGTSKFIPYVVLEQDNTTYGTEITITVKVAEITEVDGKTYYGETPFECRNVKIGVLSGPSSYIKTSRGDGVFLDGHSLYTPETYVAGDTSQRYIDTGVADREPIHADNAAARMDKIMNQRSTVSNSAEMVTGEGIWMLNDTQRLQKDSNEDLGHYFEYKCTLAYSKWIAPGELGLTTGYMQIQFDVCMQNSTVPDPVNSGLLELSYQVLN